MAALSYFYKQRTPYSADPNTINGKVSGLNVFAARLRAGYLH